MNWINNHHFMSDLPFALLIGIGIKLRTSKFLWIRLTSIFIYNGVSWVDVEIETQEWKVDQQRNLNPKMGLEMNKVDPGQGAKMESAIEPGETGIRQEQRFILFELQVWRHLHWTIQIYTCRAFPDSKSNSSILQNSQFPHNNVILITHYKIQIRISDLCFSPFL